MKAWPGYLLVGLLAYAIFLVATLPATLAYPYLKDSLAPLKLYEIEGSLWSGRARTATLGSFGSGAIKPGVANPAVINPAAINLGAVKWKAKPIALLLGRLEFTWSSRNSGSQTSGRLSRSLSGALKFENMIASVPAADVASLFTALPVKPVGVLRVKLDQLEIGDNRISAVRGVVNWQNAGVILTQAITLGNLSMNLLTAANSITGTLADQGGALQANGKLLLKPDGSYQFNATLGSRDPGQPQIRQALLFLGQPGPDGNVIIALSGVLPGAKRSAPVIAKSPAKIL